MQGQSYPNYQRHETYMCTKQWSDWVAWDIAGDMSYGRQFDNIKNCKLSSKSLLLLINDCSGDRQCVHMRLWLHL